MEELIAFMMVKTIAMVYLIVGLLLAIGAAKTKVGQSPTWGWGPAIIIILWWFPLLLLMLFTNRYKGK